ncbi:dephospho-CoA kinase [Nocardioides sp. CER19]|uniref:dephospho-CoA kinase n=1 Tax=Nocardioides sp. CER19 TaxID=3038538 RepID=UPI0024478167|nr:dephospho-CoA kinase [Nocardioides sp. CER19]MDH2416623.1 dephospho-CoA kinase [Nocardioides sp. CER19]
MRVGLTGGIGSGKSTVSGMLRELGAIVIDSDLLAREVVAPGTPGLARVVEAFGPEVLTPEGAMDRAKVGAIVFADPAQRQRLESIVWPLVREASQALAATAGPDDLVVHDIPLLVETDQQSSFDAVVVVDVPLETQVARLVGDRGWAEADARARIAAQATREERLAAATHVIDNTGSIDDLRRRVEELVVELRA